MAILILMAILTLYVLSSYWSGKLSVLQVAEAGPASYFNKHNRPKIKRLTDHDYIRSESELININEYKQLAVHGVCMEKRNIRNGDIILTKMFKKNDDKKYIISQKQTPIVVIFLFDKNYKGFKIREFVGFREDGAVDTCYYNLIGERRNSSKPHKLEQIVGIVDYVRHTDTVSNKSEGEKISLSQLNSN